MANPTFETPQGNLMVWFQQNPNWLPSIIDFLNLLSNAQVVFVSSSQAKNYPPALSVGANQILLQLPLSPSQSIPLPSGGTVIDVQARAFIAALQALQKQQGIG